MLACWLLASVSSAAYFFPDVFFHHHTSLSLLVRALHVVCSMCMASLAVAAMAPSRVDVALACAGGTPGSARCLVAFAVLYCGALFSLVAETLLSWRCRASVFRIAQMSLVGLFAQVVTHRGEILCTDFEARNLTDVANRASFSAVYAWASLAFFLCHRIEVSADREANQTMDSDSDSDGGDDAEAGGGGLAEIVGSFASAVEGDLRATVKGDKNY